MRSKTKKIVIAALLASLCCVLTMLIKIPMPIAGYVNAGDGAVLLTGFLLSPVYGFIAAGAGCMLADVFSGYIIYAPVTFIIKGIMALLFGVLLKAFSKKISKTVSKFISGAICEIVMIGGYYLFEAIIYDPKVSAVNILPNMVQGIVGVILGVILVKIFEKNKITL